MSAQVTQVTQVAMSAKAKAKAVKVPKKKMNVPPKQCDPSLPWAIHVYTIMKESNKLLLTQENVIDAYNAFVDSILKLKDQAKFRTYIPDYRAKYDNGLIIELAPDFRIHGLHYHMHPGQNADVAVKEMVDIYHVLFELIKGDVVPYMKHKHEEYMNRKHKSLYTRQLKQQEQILSTMSSRFDSMMQHYERAMQSLSDQYDRDHHRTVYAIEELKKKLANLDGINEVDADADGDVDADGDGINEVEVDVDGDGINEVEVDADADS